MDALINYEWPGNVRELENMIERAVILAEEGGALDLGHLFTTGEEMDTTSFTLNRSGGIALADEKMLDQYASLPVPTTMPGLEETESAILRAAITETNGNLSKAARLLGITRPKLAYRLRKYGIAV